MPNHKPFNNHGTAICIGIKRYKFTLQRPCMHNAKRHIQAETSFSLWGDFLPAALADEFTSTIDYSQICQLISESIMENDCSSFQNISDTLRAKLTPYFSLVYQGNISLRMKCHFTTLIYINFPS
jgi:hypothetical protein